MQMWCLEKIASPMQAYGFYIWDFPVFGRESLPVTYKTSPYFNLDYSVINTKNIVWNDDEKDDDLYTVIEDEVMIKEIPRKQYSKRTKASNCREILNQIKSLTYLVNDVDTLWTLWKINLKFLWNFSKMKHQKKTEL